MGLNEKFFKSVSAPAESDYFTPVLWTGNDTARNISTGFAPDFVWIKSRTAARNHYLYDSIRGVNNQLLTNATSAQANIGERLTAFNSDSFRIGTSAEVNNASTEKYVGWAWKAGGSAVNGAASGFTNVTKSVNSNGGFSIVKFTRQTGPWPAGTTYEHGLSSAPKLSIVKDITDADAWYVYSEPTTTSNYLKLNDSGAAFNASVFPTVNGTSIGYRVASNLSNSKDHISYNFCDVSGVQKIGSYTGSGASLNVIATGFAPTMVLFKCTSNSGTGWRIFDTVRGTDKSITVNSSGAEYDDTQNYVDFTSTGFEFSRSVAQENGDVNGSGRTYIYLAIA